MALKLASLLAKTLGPINDWMVRKPWLASLIGGAGAALILAVIEGPEAAVVAVVAVPCVRAAIWFGGKRPPGVPPIFPP